MTNELGFEQIAIPLSVDCANCPRSSIFATKGCLSAENLLVIFPTSKTMPGIWSRSLCIEKGLQVGKEFNLFFFKNRNNVTIFYKSNSIRIRSNRIKS